MDIQATKIELINWLTNLDDIDIINTIKSLKEKKSQTKKREFGSGKHLISSISEDFNEPLNEFKDYMK